MATGCDTSSQRKIVTKFRPTRRNLRGEYDREDMSIHEDTCSAYMCPSLNGFKAAYVRIDVFSMSTRAYVHAHVVYIRDTCTRSYIIMFAHAYRYCVPVSQQSSVEL